ncbi:formyltransferase family protein [Natrialba swarupiae]|uniref:Methionyl-tRNA formyltransferase n=1 Tax=Natrialba swarupiae TaxID=2448032 RepID=A0A5D5AM24_9EURY|nr:formyltransferase family protein [Natrialba swarupiae]TYT60520.1 methionyl-tRNA formyltransferase [Natrialba swarupiae]
MSTGDPVSVGLLSESFLYEWQRRAIERLQRDGRANVELVVSNANSSDAVAESWNSKRLIGLEDVSQFVQLLRREGPWALVLAERTIGRILGDEQPLWHRHTVDDLHCLEEATHVRCEPRTDGPWYEFPDEVVDRIAKRCDVVVLFGFGLIRGDILTATDHGVLSFHPADIRRYRGMGVPPIFYDGRDSAGTTLQRLNESVDGGEVVLSRDVSLHGCETMWDVFDRVVAVQSELLTEGIDRVTDPAFEPTTVPDDELGTFYPRSERRTIDFAGRVLLKNIAGRLRRRRRSHRETTEHLIPSETASAESGVTEEPESETDAIADD